LFPALLRWRIFLTYILIAELQSSVPFFYLKNHGAGF